MIQTFGKIRLMRGGTKWELYDLEPHVCIKLKALFPKIPKHQKAPFVLKRTDEVCRDIEWFMGRYPLAIDDHDQMALNHGKTAHIETVNYLANVLNQTPREAAKELKEPFKLRNYQIQVVDLFARVKHLLLGDVVGLGKTVSAIGCISSLGLSPALVVVQPHLCRQWKAEIEKYTDLRVHIIKGQKQYPLPSADVFVIGYSVVSHWVDILSGDFIRAIIFDEIQELRHKDSGKYDACGAIAESVEYRLGLSATPIYNYGNEIFNIMEILKPGALGDWPDFQREWCSNGRVVDDPQALGAYLRSVFLFLRRTRVDTGTELPPVNKLIYEVDFDQKAIDDIQKVAETLALKVMQGTFVERGQAARDLDMKVRQATGLSKAKSVAQYVKMILSSGEPVLLAGWHRAVYDIWLEELKEFKPVLYTGTESVGQKDKAKHAFISGETDLMIISLRSGVGLDGLQERCSYVVLGELDWSPGVHTQLTGRIDRDGRPVIDGKIKPVTAIYLVSNSGSDPLIVEMLGLKSSQQHGIIDPFETTKTVHSDDSRMKALARLFLKK